MLGAIFYPDPPFLMEAKKLISLKLYSVSVPVVVKSHNVGLFLKLRSVVPPSLYFILACRGK
jgi:hypothetical protein